MRLRHASVEPSGRRGIAAMWAVIVLAALSAVLAAVTIQLVSNRRALQRQQDQAQGLWLARAGVELAASRLLSQPQGYQGESPQILPEWQVHIEVKNEASGSDTYFVTSTASHRVGTQAPTTCAVSRRFRRSVDKERIRLEALLPTNDQGPLK